MALGLFIVTCASVPPQPSKPKLTWKNLRVLPRHITRDDLIATMRSWSRSLGVSCDHCHVQLAPNRTDFVTDDKPEKNAARAMFVMTHRVNVEAARVAENNGQVSCYTCHRGEVVPKS